MSWQDKLRQVEPYVAGEQPKINNMIKLNTNENPYGPCKQIKDILKEIDIEKLKLYPNSDGEELRHALAKYHGLKDEQVFLGNGSDEVLALTFLTFFNGSNPVLFPNISYNLLLPKKSSPQTQRLYILQTFLADRYSYPDQ